MGKETLGLRLEGSSQSHHEAFFSVHVSGLKREGKENEGQPASVND